MTLMHRIVEWLNKPPMYGHHAALRQVLPDDIRQSFHETNNALQKLQAQIEMRLREEDARDRLRHGNPRKQ
jgi:hypothetical protein